MSGTWSRRRRAFPSRDSARRENVAAPAPLVPVQQMQVARSLERVLEDGRTCGVLDVSARKLKQFPTNFATKLDLADLVRIDLGNNRLSELPLCLCEVQSLETLQARGNQLRRIPSAISGLHSLTYLDLNNNQLRELPAALFDLPLEILLLSGNRLDVIPRLIRQLSSSLVELDVSANGISCLPSDLALLSSLRVLNVAHNKIEYFPPELCGLCLHTLDLSCNSLTRLPVEMRHMRSLCVLDLEGNPLVFPPQAVLVKGREHVFKWLLKESSDARIINSSTIKSMNLSCDPKRASTGRSLYRGNTLGGSDSGYDEKNLEGIRYRNGQPRTRSQSKSREWIVIDSLAEHAEPDHVTGDVNGNTQNDDAFDAPSSLSSSSQDVPSSECMTIMYDKKVSDRILEKCPLGQTNTNGSVNTTSPLSAIPQTKKEKPKVDVAVASPVSATSKPRPVSKVAPMPSRPPIQSKTTVPVKKVIPSSLPPKRIPVAGPPRVSPKTTPPSQTTTARAPVVRKPASVKERSAPPSLPKAPPVRGPIRVIANKNSKVVNDAALMETLKKTLEERLGTSVPPSALSDGVLLCKLFNTFHPSGISSIFLPPDVNTPLSAVKSKRNVETFLNACRAVGIRVACNADDVVLGKNTPNIARTILALTKNENVSHV